jgi:signal transduction histidine kinase
LRAAIFELTPPEPDWTKLDIGLERFVADLAAARDLCVAFAVDGDPRPVDPDAVSVVFAVVQEALANVAKHADTKRARVHVAFGPEAVTLTVSDEGSGLGAVEAVDLAHQGLGLLRTRARLAGATLEIGDDGNSGTVIRLEVPTSPAVESAR